MDIVPLYDIRDRLRAAAVAGTALLNDDFRLRRALDSFAPLEVATPVFAKIAQTVRELLSPECADAAPRLLDALSLCDAVLTTQASCGADGPVEPLPLSEGILPPVSAPHSILSPLVTALTGTGSGRYSLVTNTHDERPEVFRDYRVIGALIMALGDSYSELADGAERWLTEAGEIAVSSLKRGFDPAGGKAMVRRLRILEKVRGAAENEFYLSLIESAKKDVRAEAIYALRLDGQNAERLIQLAKTEKGDAQKAAHWALAALDGEPVADYWRSLALKKPCKALEYLYVARSAAASALVSELFTKALDAYEADPKTEVGEENAELLRQGLNALMGKTGESVVGAFRRAAAIGTKLDKATEDGKNPLRFSCVAGYSINGRPFSEAVAFQLARSIKLNPSADLCELAFELHNEHGKRFAAPAALAALLVRESSAAYEIAMPVIHQFGKGQETVYRFLDNAGMNELYPVDDGSSYVIRVTFAHPFEDASVTVEHALAAPPDLRWFRDMTKLSGYDHVLGRFIPSSDVRLREILTDYFVEKAADMPRSREYAANLTALGYTECKGFAERYCKYQNKNAGYLFASDLVGYMEVMPGSPADKADEAERVLRLAESKKITFRDADGIDILRGELLKLRGTH